MRPKKLSETRAQEVGQRGQVSQGSEGLEEGLMERLAGELTHAV